MQKIIFIALFFLCTQNPTFANENKVLDIQKITILNNVEAWLVEDHSVPVISLSFSFEGGTSLDPSDKPGVANLTSTLLDEGAGELNSSQFQAELDNNSISMDFTAGRDAFYGELKTLTENKNKAFDLLKIALISPHFDKDAIYRMKNSTIAQIKSSMGNPGWLAARSFNGIAFKGHPYSLPGAGNLKSMERITRDDLLNFTQAQFAKNLLKVSIAGDISPSSAQQALNLIFGSLPEDIPQKETLPAELQNSGKTVLLKLNTPQTFITVGENGIERSDPDWHAATIMNYILGGGSFDARLMKEIREKRGLTYGIYSSINSMKDASLIQASFSTSNEKTEEALNLLKQEWDKMAKNGATEQEIKDAKSYITGSLLLELTSTSDISSTINGLQRYNLDYNYINNRNAAINAVTAEDIKRVAARLLKSENLITVLVGNPKNVHADIVLDQPPEM